MCVCGFAYPFTRAGCQFYTELNSFEFRDFFLLDGLLYNG